MLNSALFSSHSAYLQNVRAMHAVQQKVIDNRLTILLTGWRPLPSSVASSCSRMLRP